MLYRKKIDDERIKALRHKITGEAFKIVCYLLIASIFIKKVILNFPNERVLTEFVVLIVMSLYVIIRSVAKGIYLIQLKTGETGKRKIFRICMYSLLGGIGAGVIIGAIEYFKNGAALCELPMIILPILLIIPIVLTIGYIVLDTISSKKVDKNISKNDK